MNLDAFDGVDATRKDEHMWLAPLTRASGGAARLSGHSRGGGGHQHPATLAEEFEGDETSDFGEGNATTTTSSSSSSFTGQQQQQHSGGGGGSRPLEDDLVCMFGPNKLFVCVPPPKKTYEKLGWYLEWLFSALLPIAQHVFWTVWMRGVVLCIMAPFTSHNYRATSN